MEALRLRVVSLRLRLPPLVNMELLLLQVTGTRTPLIGLRTDTMLTPRSSRNGSSSNTQRTTLRLDTRRLRLPGRQGLRAHQAPRDLRRLRANQPLPRLPRHNRSCIRLLCMNVRSVSNRYMLLCTVVPQRIGM
ncbi:hypothetical protein BD309DRAFT_952740 [Dichomitus squalens]|uniref:Uncharacterized protein n=1 Tax=Dichomitus squalens TaxID=114155 RepID=A0A4Q9Q1L8_9APHY|nr:hypothetical protein BD309DRAFT_952740 [Dichomitus squalens]TBU61093.1 hypothetical protein BD310DRAFT_921460 [Dichomitus squalens]